MKKSLLLAFAFCVFTGASAQVNITVGPYLQSPTPSSIKILWRTDTAATSKIMYGTDLANLNLTVTDTALVTRHDVELSALAPYTKYFYAVYDGNTLLEGIDSSHWFRTFPIAGTEVPFRVWAIGDFGKGNSKQAAVRDAFVNYDTTETNFWIWLGDNAYSDGTEQEYITKVFDSVYGYKKLMKHLPFLPTPGNHDYNSISPVASPKPPLTHTGPYYDFVDVYKNGEAGGVPTGHELFYSYDYANAHFISLNSELGSLFTAADDWTGVSPFNTFTSSPMTQWLTQDLQANTKPWVIVYFHQPPYTDGSHDTGAWWEVYMKAMRQHFAPIWEQYGVDLVVCGHSHVYERSYLVKGAYGNTADINPTNYVQSNNGIDSMGQAFVKYTGGTNPNQGTVYVVNGNSGSSDGSAPLQHPYMYSSYGCDTCCGSFIIDINGNRLDGREIDATGVVRDHFTMFKESGTGINDLNKDFIAGLKVMPNPFSNTTKVTFELKADVEIKIQLSDVAGKAITIYSGKMNKGQREFQIDARQLKLAKGAYVLNLSTPQKQIGKTILNIE